jgi:hypothetical protein
VSAGAIDERGVVSFVLRHGRGARSDCRWKTPRIGNAHAFHEAPAEPVLAAFEPKHGTRPKSGPRRRARRRRQGRQRRTVSFTRGGRKRRPARRYQTPKWESRREARFSPVSSASGGPSLPVPVPRVFGRAGERAKKTLARMSTEPRGSGTRAVLGQAPKGPAREIDRCAGKRREARVLEWERFRSAEVDRSHRRSRRPRALPSAPRTRAT